MWNRLKQFRANNREEGFTLVEILVAIVLLGIVTAGITATIIAVTSTTQNFTASATTQNEAADAISEITRDISSAIEMTYADDYRISFVTAEDNKRFEVSYFYWHPDGSGPELPNGINTANLPNEPALIQWRKQVGAFEGKETILVTGYLLERQQTVLFTYFNKANQDLVTPIEEEALETIVRVQYQFALKVQDRNALIELASSATPRYAATDINNGGVNNNYTSCSAPVLSGNLAARTQNANLSWTSVTNANTYTIYRTNPNQAVSPMVVGVINSGVTTSYTDSTVTWGEKYGYYVIAGCPVGTSPRSNIINLTATPPQVVIINQNTTKGLSDTLAGATEAGTVNPVQGRTYTVARGLVNQIVWAPANGAEGYLVFRNGTQIANITNPAINSYQDTGRNYGDVLTYTVLAYNTGQNGSGGNGFTSDGKQLISPPIASTISVTPLDTSTDSTYSSNRINVTTRASNTTGFTVQRHTTAAAAADCTTAGASSPVAGLAFTGSTVTDSNVEWASSTCYIVTGYNDAGPGLPSTGQTANQLPGKYSVLSTTELGTYSRMNSYYDLDSYGSGGTSSFRVDWSDSVGATGYSVNKVISASGGIYLDGSNTTHNPGANSIITFSNTTPGTYYSVIVDAVAPNGRTRQVTTTFVTAPEPPTEAHSIIQSRAANPYTRRLTQFTTVVKHGMATSMDGIAYFVGQNVGWTTCNYGTGGGWCYAYSPPQNTGNTAGAVRSYLSYAGWSKYSAQIGWDGVVATAGCVSACGSSFSNIAERAPDYYAGHHGYYVII